MNIQQVFELMLDHASKMDGPAVRPGFHSACTYQSLDGKPPCLIGAFMTAEQAREADLTGQRVTCLGDDILPADLQEVDMTFLFTAQLAHDRLAGTLADQGLNEPFGQALVKKLVRVGMSWELDIPERYQQ